MKKKEKVEENCGNCRWHQPDRAYCRLEPVPVVVKPDDFCSHFEEKTA